MLQPKALRLVGLLFLVHAVFGLVQGSLLSPSWVPSAFACCMAFIDAAVGVALLRGHAHWRSVAIYVVCLRLLLAITTFISAGRVDVLVLQVVSTGSWLMLLVGAPGPRRQRLATVGILCSLLVALLGLGSLLSSRLSGSPVARSPDAAVPAGGAPTPKVASTSDAMPLPKELTPALQFLVEQATVFVHADNATGSGVVIALKDERIFILTSAHVVQKPSGELRRRIGVEFPVQSNQVFHLSKVVTYSSALDLALIETPRFPRQIIPLPIATTDPALGASVLSVGFPNSDYRIEDASFTAGRVLSNNVEMLGKGHLLTDAIVDHGNSGGPVVDTLGRVVGIVRARPSGDHRCLAVRAPALHQFLQGLAEPLPLVSTLPVTPQAALLPPLEIEHVRRALVELHEGQVSVGYGVGVGRRGGELLVLLSTPKDFEGARVSSATVTVEGQPRVIGQVRHLARLKLDSYLEGAVHLFAMADPGPGSTVLAVRSTDKMKPPRPLLLAHPEEKGMLVPATLVRRDGRALRLQLEGSRPRIGAPLVDARDGSLLGFAGRPIDHLHYGLSSDGFLQELMQQLQSVRLSWTPAEGASCRVQAEVLFWPPQPHLQSLGLLVAPVGDSPPIATDGEGLRPIGPSVAHDRVAGDWGRVSATLEDCSTPRFVQLWLWGTAQRWLAIPFELPAHGREPGEVMLPLEKTAWRIDSDADPDPLQWVEPRKEGAAPPVAAGACPMDSGKFDPAAVYLAALGFEKDCAEVVLSPIGRPEERHCVRVEEGTRLPMFLRGERLLYVNGMKSSFKHTLRELVPDALVVNPFGRCGHEFTAEAQASWVLNDPVRTFAPCEHNLIPEFFDSPDGQRLMQCGREYLTLEGKPVDLRDASLVNLGVGGRALVWAPDGRLAVRGPDGLADEVRDLPATWCPLCSIASVATQQGFLVALPHGSRDPAELFEVSLDGKARSRGAYPTLTPSGQTTVLDRRMTPEGILYLLVRSEGESLLNLYALEARAREPRLVSSMKRTNGDGSFAPRLISVPWSRASTGGPIDERNVQAWSYRQPRKPSEDGCVFERHSVGFGSEVFLLRSPAGKKDAPVVYTLLGSSSHDDALLDPWRPQGVQDGRFLYREHREVRVYDPRLSRPTSGKGRVCVTPSEGQPPALYTDRPTAPDYLSLSGFSPRPDGRSTVFELISRTKAAPKRFLLEGQRRTPLGEGRRLLQAGVRGHVLVGSTQAIEVLAPGGRPTRVQGIPTEGWKAARARADGFEVALFQPQTMSSPAVLELWSISLQGKARRVGTFSGSALIESSRDMVLGPGQSLYAYSKSNAFWSDEGIVELSLGKKPPRLVWSQRGPSSLELGLVTQALRKP